jgi:alpha-tubulin suppressor-like RCC1 family protein
VSCWGNNDRGQLGVPPGAGDSGHVEVPGLALVAEVSAGFSHTCALRVSGDVLCWGRNNVGQLGDGTTEPRTGVVASSVTDATGLNLGWGFGCALRGRSSPQCWGANESGELGDGTTETRPTPGPVIGL